jgi:lysozyme
MKTSAQGLSLLMQREGVRLTPYQDTEGNWTDGVGNTHGVVPNGPPITHEKAMEDLERNVAWAEDAVTKCVTVPLNQDQFDALVSFTFNAGPYALPNGDHGGPCSILRALNAGNYIDAAQAFRNWCNPASITSRRMGEMFQFAGTRFEARVE